MSNVNVGKNRNFENIFLRNCTVGLLSILDSQIVIDYKFENGDTRLQYIPFYYGLQQYQYNQDAFVDDMPHEFRMTEGNLSSPPVGSITYTGLSIDSGELTNPNVAVPISIYSYEKEEYETFLEYIRNIPITLRYECNILLNSESDVLKVQTAVLYSYQTISFEYLGIVIPISLEFPDETDIDITKVNNAIDGSKIEVKFGLEVKVTYPAFRKPYINDKSPTYAKRVHWYKTIFGDNNFKNSLNNE
jgi:hypothetical protein